MGTNRLITNLDMIWQPFLRGMCGAEHGAVLSKQVKVLS